MDFDWSKMEKNQPGRVKNKGGAKVLGMARQEQPKIYHIVHIDRLSSIIADGYLWSDARIAQNTAKGTVIGMNTIKQRRLNELTLASHPHLYVGECVPFYFCPRSIMLYLIFRGNHQELSYRGGQEPIIHLEADLLSTVDWANQNGNRWAFTLSNAGAYYFEDRCDLARLDEIDWQAVHSNQWSEPSVKEGKQAEFLIERCFPWQLIDRIGVNSEYVYRQVVNKLPTIGRRPQVEMRKDWYY